MLALLVAAALISLGPGLLGDMISGLLFKRPPAASISVTPPRADSDLQARLNGVASSVPRGRLAAVATDLRTGASAAIDADRAYPAASLFKLPILLEVLAEQETGRLEPDRKVEIRPEDWTDGSGVLQARIGDQLTVRELTRLMIQDSDNIAALALLDVVGVAAVNDTAAQVGLRATRLVDHRAGEDGDHVTTANDMARLLAGLATGTVISQHVSEQALSVLELRQSVSWLGGGLPFWVKIAHKWGDLPDARNDVGIVFTPRGSYVIAVLTQDGTPEDMASAIERASRLTYEYVSGR